MLMPNTSDLESQPQNFSSKLVLLVILVFVIIGGIFLWPKKSVKVEEEKVVPGVPPSSEIIKGREPERIDRDESKIKTEAQIVEEQIMIINASGVKKKVGLDTSTKYRQAVLNFLKKSLADFGYTMTINNLATATDQLKPVAGEEGKHFQSSCGQYRYEVNPTTQKINIYYYVADAVSACPELFIMKPVQGSFMEMGGGLSFWSSGLKAIFEPEGLNYQADDAPFTTVVP